MKFFRFLLLTLSLYNGFAVCQNTIITDEMEANITPQATTASCPCDYRKKGSENKAKCKDEQTCGYVVEYDVCTNCYSIFKTKIAREKGKNLVKNFICVKKKVKSIKAGKAVQFRMDGLNLVKYNTTVRSYADTSQTGWQALITNAANFFTGIGVPSVSLGDVPFVDDCKPVASDDAQTKLMRECNCEADKQKNNLKQAVEAYEIEVIKMAGDMEEIRTYLLRLNDAADCGNFTSINTDKDKIISVLATRYGSGTHNIVSKMKELHLQKRKDIENIYAKITKVKSGECKNIKDELSEFKQQADKFDADLDKFQSLVTSLNTKIPAYFHYNIPQVPVADAIGFLVTVEPGDTMLRGGIRVSEQPIEIPVHGGVRLHIGTGLLLTGFRNDSYSLVTEQDTSNGSGKRLVRNSLTDINKLNVGFSVLGFASTPLPNVKHVSLGGCFGVGFASDLNFSFLLGGTVMFGKFPKIGLSGGYALSSVKTPISSINMPAFNGARSELVDNSITDANKLLEYDFKSNWFFSITVDFGKPPGRILSKSATSGPAPKSAPAKASNAAASGS